MTLAARRAKSRTHTGGIGNEKDQPFSEYDSGTDDDEEEHEEGDDADSVTDVTDEDNYGEPEPSKPQEPEAPVSPPQTPIAAPTKPTEPVPDAPINGTSTLATGDDATPRNSVDPASHPLPVSPPKAHPTSAPTSPPKAPQTQPKNALTMLPSEARIIARLAKRVNVLPIIARADTLTDSRLERIKKAVKRDLANVGVGAGKGGARGGGRGKDGRDGVDVWTIWDAEAGVMLGRPALPTRSSDRERDHDRDVFSASTPNTAPPTPNANAAAEDDRPTRPVIKLRSTLRGLTRSRSRKSLKSAVGADVDEPDAEATPGYPLTPSNSLGPGEGGGDRNSMISRRESVNSTATGVKSEGGQPSGTYDAVFSRADLKARMPFAVIAPEKHRPSKHAHTHGNGAANGNGNGSVNGHDFGVYGRFTRKFRWGTIDVLDPHHCDFAALRAAVLGSYMRVSGGGLLVCASCFCI